MRKNVFVSLRIGSLLVVVLLWCLTARSGKAAGVMVLAVLYAIVTPVVKGLTKFRRRKKLQFFQNICCDSWTEFLIVVTQPFN